MQPTEDDGYVGPRHLAEEVVRADRESEFLRVNCLWDLVQTIEAYRERLQDWRWLLLRGGYGTGRLIMCPRCRRVLHLLLPRADVTCHFCNHQWAIEGLQKSA
jgi:hypothetical protein